jgi:hypothetical protein
MIATEEKKTPAEFETAGIIKTLRKIKSMELSLVEWAESKFIELANTLRKYPNSTEVAKEAKEIRSFLKDKMTKMAVAAPPAAPANGN